MIRKLTSNDVFSPIKIYKCGILVVVSSPGSQSDSKYHESCLNQHDIANLCCSLELRTFLAASLAACYGNISCNKEIYPPYDTFLITYASILFLKFSLPVYSYHLIGSAVPLSIIERTYNVNV